jgi:hypothetical protein
MCSHIHNRVKREKAFPVLLQSTKYPRFFPRRGSGRMRKRQNEHDDVRTLYKGINPVIPL